MTFAFGQVASTCSGRCLRPDVEMITVKGASGAFLIPMERISRSIKNVAEGISFGPASGFVVAPIRKLAEAFEGFATGGREVLGVNQALPSVMRELKCPNQINTSRRGFNDDELRGMPMLTV